jgi:hypothetical protein
MAEESPSNAGFKSLLGRIVSFPLLRNVYVRVALVVVLLVLIYIVLSFFGFFGADKAATDTDGTGRFQRESSKAPRRAPIIANKEVETSHAAESRALADSDVEGVRFTKAFIGVLDYELRERGWRPNSIISGKLHLTDNVRNYQLGVLETVRQVGLIFKEKISRYGDSDKFDHRLEDALNFFMMKADQFWFPAADDQYRQGIEELGSYLEDLQAGLVRFYARSDNFEALILACKELLGNCHYNLVKEKERDGSTVSFFSVDNYFYYSKGVAKAMGEILETTLYDFKEELSLIKGTALMREVVADLKYASELDPWIILDGDLDGIIANHRANMAVPLGQALFKLSNMLKFGGGSS